MVIKEGIDLRIISSSEVMLENYYNKMDRLSHDMEYCRMVWDERIEMNLRKAEAYDEGLEDGKIEGRREGKIEMIKNLFQKGIDINTIAECSYSSIDEIKKIVNYSN